MIESNKEKLFVLLDQIMKDEMLREHLYAFGNVKEVDLKTPREVLKIKTVNLPSLPVFEHLDGSLVAIKPVDDKYKNKTCLGILLGHLPEVAFASYDNKDKAIVIINRENPAIFVPELKKIIYGYESWWKIIKSVEEFQEITSEEIQGIWYVQLLKQELKRMKDAGNDIKQNDFK